MKKIIMLGFFTIMTGINIYGRCGYGYRYGHNYYNSNYYNEKCYSEEEYHESRYFQDNKELEKLRIFFEEKRLEIQKEMIKDNPDWEKIEKLNIELETEKAKAKTKYIQSKYAELHRE